MVKPTPYVNLWSRVCTVSNTFSGYCEHGISYLLTKLFFVKGDLRDAIQRKKIKRILVVNLGHLGEMVVSTALLRVLRQNFPDAKIVVVGGQWALPVLENSGLGDSYITYNSKRYDRHSAVKFSLAHIVSLFRLLRAERFDLVVDLRSDYWVFFSSLLIGARYRYDYGTTRVKKLFRHLSTNSQPWESGHYLEQRMAILDEMGIPRAGVLPKLFVSSPADNIALNILQIHSPADFVVIIHPFAEWVGREWPANNYVKLCQYLCDKPGVKVLVSGKANERDRAGRIVDAVRGDIHNMAGEMSLKELPAFIRNASLFISSDGGAMHLAAALGVPLIALFGPQSPVAWAPVSSAPAKVLYKKMQCSPCAQTMCSQGFECMASIAVQDVVTAVEELMINLRVLNIYD